MMTNVDTNIEGYFGHSRETWTTTLDHEGVELAVAA